MEQENTIRFSGKLLIPGFSIYLMEVTIDGVPDEETEQLPSTWYYIGMTGDNYYPSARSAFHRISGHLELSDASTQNQLYNGIQGLLDNRHQAEGHLLTKTWRDVNITMTSYPIAGFEDQHWKDWRSENGLKFTRENMRQISAIDENDQYTYPQYSEYKIQQTSVLNFEKQLIRYAKGKLSSGHLFNSGPASEDNFNAGDYEWIAQRICERMNIEW